MKEYYVYTIEWFGDDEIPDKDIREWHDRDTEKQVLFFNKERKYLML